jgi:peptidoglycan hydrolase CwlO-like protein
MNQMTQENPVQRKSNMKIIALVVVCVILAASLVGVIAVYVPNNSQAQLTEKENTINSLQTQIGALEYQISKTNSTTYASQIANLNSQLSDLNNTLTSVYADYSSVQNDYASLQEITQLTTSELWYQNSFSQNGNATTSLGTAQVDYAGYVVVQATATANSTYAEVLYTFDGINMDFNQTIGTSGTALFPLLPGSVEIRMGNINQSNANNITATITHYY